MPYRNPVFAFSRESWRWAHQACHLNYYQKMGSSIWYNKSLKINKKSVMWENWVKAWVMLLQGMCRFVQVHEIQKSKKK